MKVKQRKEGFRFILNVARLMDLADVARMDMSDDIHLQSEVNI